MLQDGSFTLLGKRADHGKDRTLHFEQKLDFVKFQLSETNSKEIAAKFRIEKNQLAEVAIFLFDLACTHRVAMGWDAEEIFKRLQTHYGEEFEGDLKILAENLRIMAAAIEKGIPVVEPT